MPNSCFFCYCSNKHAQSDPASRWGDPTKAVGAFSRPLRRTLKHFGLFKVPSYFSLPLPMRLFAFKNSCFCCRCLVVSYHSCSSPPRNCEAEFSAPWEGGRKKEANLIKSTKHTICWHSRVQTFLYSPDGDPTRGCGLAFFSCVIFFFFFFYLQCSWEAGAIRLCTLLRVGRC